MINDKQHGPFLQDSVLEGNIELRDRFPMNIVKFENHFNLQDTFIKTMNNPSRKYEVAKEDTKSL